jgi:hypothetical protein
VRAGTTTFGPVGRTVLSVVPVLAATATILLALRFRSGPAIAFFLVAAVATNVWVVSFLRVVWQKDRID